MIHLYYLAVQADFYRDAVECWSVTQAARVRSQAAALVIRIFSPVTHVKSCLRAYAGSESGPSLFADRIIGHYRLSVESKCLDALRMRKIM